MSERNETLDQLLRHGGVLVCAPSCATPSLLLFPYKDLLNGQPKEFGESECKSERGIVLATLQVADRLGVDPNALGKLHAAQLRLLAQLGNAVWDWRIITRLSAGHERFRDFLRARVPSR